MVQDAVFEELPKETDENGWTKVVYIDKRRPISKFEYAVGSCFIILTAIAVFSFFRILFFI